MRDSFILYFSELIPSAQEEILKLFGVNSPEEMNWDIFPIAEIPVVKEEQNGSTR